ncbi:aminoacyl-histidine dipeptidase [Erysipelothrix sp. HDW6C]|uniref:beta-Ala-His dipeptidase n=1 Tax=Erysipelothrix sp. HDW6C TaxID=2714930 RepID=UPI001409D706|nr:beta-Ala-His dipeptidase [Erysipelothrix sp. HDW6C]QIK70005.1 aminoacyl-histidine dipeptidase [Erysipelothrix sp. HDW6C]
MNESVVMKYFREISAIPRASFNEEGMRDHLAAFADTLGLKYVTDHLFNIIIFKPATAGYEAAPVVMLQSHTDMVAETNKGSNHNFDTDPLDLYIEEGILHARGTTLGADDGAGVAYMMAILADTETGHPALECVFTVQEETGLTGATELDTSMLEASLCIGLDGSGETETYVSSCGGVRGALTRTVNYESVTMPTVTVRIRGLLGGHSGGEIDQERGNASKLAGIIMRRALDQFAFHVVAIDGGLKENAITRENDFTIALSDPAVFTTWFKGVEKELQEQYEFSDNGLNFIIETGSTTQVLSEVDTEAVVNTLFMLPYGVIQKSKAIADLVITSANIGTVRLDDECFKVTVSLRATQGFVIENIMRQVEWVASTNGLSVEFSSRYPGWNYDANSKFRERTLEVYKEMRGEAMETVATHGGLELGIWKGKMPNLDIVSFGPIMFDIHTPDERLDIASFDRTYQFMVALLASLNNY